MTSRWILRSAALAGACLAAAFGEPVLAADADARVTELIAAATQRGDPVRSDAAAAELLSFGDTARAQIAAILGDSERPPPALVPLLEALDAAAMLRAEAADGGFAFWAALDEARARVPRFDAVLPAAIPDAAARQRIEETDAAAAKVVADVLATVRKSGTFDGATHAKLAEAGPGAFVRVLDALAGADAAQGDAALSVVATVGAPECVPHLVWLAADRDLSATTGVAAAAALARVAGYVVPADSAPGPNAVAAWWRARKSVVAERGALRLLAHRVLLGLEAPGVSDAIAFVRLERLAVLLKGAGWRANVSLEETAGTTPRLTSQSVRKLRDLWRRAPPPPATWRGALAVLGGVYRYDGCAIGEGGDRSETRRAYDIVAAEAPTEAIAGAMSAPSVVARTYALRALFVREGASARAGEAIVRLSRGGGTMPAMFGCESSRMRPFDALVEDMLWDGGAELRRPLLELLLDRDLHPPTLAQLLRTVALDPARRPQLQKLADAGVPAALGGIALWHAPEDVPYLVAKAESAGASVLDRTDLLDAVTTHGGVGTVPALVRAVPPARTRCETDRRWDPMPYLGAVAAPGDAAAEAALSDFLGPDAAKADERVAEAVEATLAAAPHAAFAGLRWRHWESVRWSAAASVEELAKLDLDRAVRLVRRDFGVPFPPGERESRLRRLGAPKDRTDVDALVRPRLAFLRTADAAAAAEWAAANVGGEVSEVAQAICAEASAWHDDRLVDPLVLALGGTANRTAILATARALLCYGKPEIDERVRKTVAATKDLREGWAGKAMAELLAKLPRTWDAGERK